MRAHSRKSSARSVRGDGVTATRNARVPNTGANVLTRAMDGTLEQFREKCEAVFPGKAHSAFPWELRQNKELERFAVSVKR